MAAGKWDFEQALLAGTVPAAVWGGKFRPNPFRPADAERPMTPEQRKRVSADAWDDLRFAMKRLYGKKQKPCATSTSKTPPSSKG